MATGKTARELAQQAISGGRVGGPKFDAIRLLETVGVILLLAGSLFMFYSAWSMQQRDGQAESLREAAAQIQKIVQNEVNSALTKVESAVAEPAIVAHFSQGAEMDLAQTRAALRSALGEATEIDIISGSDVLATLDKDLAVFGYAKSDMLLQAQGSKGLSPAQFLLETNQSRTLAVCSAVLRQSEVLGYVLVRFDASKLLDAFAQWRGAGRIEMRQGSGEGLLIESSGELFYMDRGAPVLPIARSALRLVHAMPSDMLSLGLGLLGSTICGVVLLGAAGALTWVRIMPRMSQSKRVSTPPLKEPATPPIETEADSGKPSEPAPNANEASKANTTASPASVATPPAPRSSEAPLAVKVDRSIFRAYDIRGVVGDSLTPAVANLIGRAVGSEIRARNLKEVVVARDGRLSGPSLIAGLIEGLRATGCDVIDIGMVPTPVLYFATHELRAQSGVMLTGSHNPPEYNGFKIVVGGETLSDQSIQDLYGRIAEQRFSSGAGSIQNIDVLDAYVERISSDIQLETPLKVVADCGNGVPGVIAEKLLASIGCEVEPLYTEVDGNFPNHHPDPSEPKNLRDLILTVKQIKADIGVAFDGDGDRLGVVTPRGKIIYPDRLLMLFAKDVLVRNPGATIIFDVKCTGHLTNVIRGAGGIPMMWRTGHSLIKGKMRETQAELAGEMSGHFFFKERWFGFDDGLYAACRLLEIVAASGLDIDELFDDLPDSVSTPELKIPMTEGEHYRFMEKFKDKARFEGARITSIDGVRADWDDGWGLVRCSNTTPVLVLRFDAVDEQVLQRIQDVFRQQLLALGPKLSLPF